MAMLYGQDISFEALPWDPRRVIWPQLAGRICNRDCLVSATQRSPLTGSTATPRGQLTDTGRESRTPQEPTTAPSLVICTTRWFTVSMMLYLPSGPTATARGSLNTAELVSGGGVPPIVWAYLNPVDVRSKRTRRQPHRSAPQTSPSAATATRRNVVNVPGWLERPGDPIEVRYAPVVLNIWIRLLLESAT